jgi:uncharacterized protein YqgC (DUF456 family)
MKIILAVREKPSLSKAAGTKARATLGSAVAAGWTGAAAGSLGSVVKVLGEDPLPAAGAADGQATWVRAVVVAPAIAGMAARWPPKRRIRKTTRAMPATASSASMRKLPKASPRPRWLIRAAMPRPAARPAMGPIQDRLAAAAGAAPATGAAALAGVACCAGVAGLGGGASGAVRAGMSRCMPAGLPPPKRLASETEGSVVPTSATTRAPRSQFFMETSPLEDNDECKNQSGVWGRKPGWPKRALLALPAAGEMGHLSAQASCGIGLGEFKHAAPAVRVEGRRHMTVVALWVLVVALILLGLAGTVVPALPGPALVLGAVVLGAWIDDFTRVGVGTLVVIGLLALLAWALDYAAGLLGARRVGASRQALLGAVLGTVVGLFMGVVGVLFMPLVGAAAGEYLARQHQAQAGQRAMKVGVATWLGIMAGLLAKVVISFMMVGVFVVALWW